MAIRMQFWTNASKLRRFCGSQYEPGMTWSCGKAANSGSAWLTVQLSPHALLDTSHFMSADVIRYRALKF